MGKDFNPEKIDHDKTESIHVLRGKKATDKYGEKAAEGMMEIETREEK